MICCLVSDNAVLCNHKYVWCAAE